MTAEVKEADEAAAVRARYPPAKRCAGATTPLNPAVLLPTQERQRAIADLFVTLGWLDLAGCGC